MSEHSNSDHAENVEYSVEWYNQLLENEEKLRPQRIEFADNLIKRIASICEAQLRLDLPSVRSKRVLKESNWFAQPKTETDIKESIRAYPLSKWEALDRIQHSKNLVREIKDIKSRLTNICDELIDILG